MRRVVAIALIAAALAGCAELQPFDPPVAGEIPPGPGLFTGADGAFVVTPGSATGQATAEAPPPAAPPPPPRQPLRLPPSDQDFTLPPPQ